MFRFFSCIFSLVRPINNASTAVLKNLNEEVKKQLETNIKVRMDKAEKQMGIFDDSLGIIFHF